MYWRKLVVEVLIRDDGKHKFRCMACDLISDELVVPCPCCGDPKTSSEWVDTPDVSPKSGDTLKGVPYVEVKGRPEKKKEQADQEEETQKEQTEA